jgi:hypothetical protein
MKIEASESPISAAKIQNVVCAALTLILRMRAPINKTTPSGASMITHWSGLPYITWASWVK